ncbi:MAG: hypothetical protein IK095_05165 [Oscillospiraceae bacterium]|nr:hypothetical protein [Oscillospiraceae bacterium]
MTCIERFQQDHPFAEPELYILRTCPVDHGYTPAVPPPCLRSPNGGIENCKACWNSELKRETVEPEDYLPRR